MQTPSQVLEAQQETQATVSSLKDADKTSTSPSPSTSMAKTE